MARKKTEEDITIIKTASGEDTSKQIADRFARVDGILTPKHDPEALIYAYDESFVIGGIVDRFASTSASGWLFPEWMSDESKKVLKTIDLEYLFSSLFITGNVYFEKIRTKSGKKIARFKPFITSEVRLSRKWNEPVTYNQIVQWSMNPVPFSEEDVLHIRLKSMSSRYYGDSKFFRCIRQVVLLGLIDKYYESIFDGWFFWSSILLDKENKLTSDQKTAIKSAITDKLRGVKSAFSTMILPAELDIIKLYKDFDPEAFLKYRKDLIQSIAIALNIPYDLLVPEGSARGTKESSLEEFNRDIVSPIQERVIMQILEQITEEEIQWISEINLIAVDTKNQKEEMEVDTGYRDSGVLTANEIREKLGKDSHPDGDKLEVRGKSSQSSMNPAPPENPTISKMEEQISKMYASYGE